MVFFPLLTIGSCQGNTLLAAPRAKKSMCFHTSHIAAIAPKSERIAKLLHKIPRMGRISGTPLLLNPNIIKKLRVNKIMLIITIVNQTSNIKSPSFHSFSYKYIIIYFFIKNKKSRRLLFWIQLT